MRIRPNTKDAYNLFHRGTLALAKVEQVGIRVDVPYLEKKIVSTTKKIERLGKELREDKLWDRIRRRFGDKAKLSSRDQLAEIVFHEMGFEAKSQTEGKIDRETGNRITRAKADDTNLRDTGLPYCEKFLLHEKLIKAKNTFLLGIHREVHCERLRTFFNLAGGTADDTKGDPRTYRSSSDSPNVHNFPTRDAELGKLIRRAFIPSEGNVLIEADFKGIEVSIAYCYHKDPVMRKYLLDKNSDMHRDVAIDSFKISPKTPNEWWKAKGELGGYNVRYSAKNKFTFPQFYGDWWKQCAKNLWDDIRRLKLHSPEGLDLKEHLKRNGIRKLGDCDPKVGPSKGTFEHHIKDAENIFWNKRFKVYQQWKTEWDELYQKRGWFPLHTGFVCTGFYNKKQVINYPVQGAAFHCLLWCLIKLQEWIENNNLRTRIVSQIHDSMILDSPIDEVDRVVSKLRNLMMEELLNEWDWIVIPLEVEIDIAQDNWFEKIGYEEWKTAA